MKRNVARWVRKLLAGEQRNTSGRKIYPEYISFDDGSRPGWWKDELADDQWGRIFGVHEYEPNNPINAFMVTEMGLAVFGEGGKVTWLPYTRVKGWEKLSKEPVSMSLRVQVTSGGVVELFFPRPGGAFTFVQFLDRAIWEHVHRPGADQERS